MDIGLPVNLTNKSCFFNDCEMSLLIQRKKKNLRRFIAAATIYFSTLVSGRKMCNFFTTAPSMSEGLLKITYKLKTGFARSRHVNAGDRNMVFEPKQLSSFRHTHIGQSSIKRSKPSFNFRFVTVASCIYLA